MICDRSSARRLNRAFMVLIVMMSALGCGPKLNATTQLALEEWRSGLKTSAQAFDAPTSYDRPPPVAGSWATYLETHEGGEITRVTFKILEVHGDQIWFEAERLSPYHHTITKMLILAANWQDPALWAPERLIYQEDADRPTEVPAMDWLASRTDALNINAFNATSDGTLETLSTSAGLFVDAKKILTNIHTSDELVQGFVWAHNAVPVTGYVKVASGDATYTAELTAFGLEGASSAITGEIRDLSL